MFINFLINSKLNIVIQIGLSLSLELPKQVKSVELTSDSGRLYPTGEGEA